MTAFWEKAKGYRTLAFNLLTGGLAFLEVTDVSALIPDRYEAVFTIFVAVGNFWLRTQTTTAVGKA